MPRSMTGYGRCILLRDGREVTLELKSVNHRFLDVAFRMPRSFAFLEGELRARIAKRLARGHVDVFISYKNARDDARKVRLDAQLLDAYVAALRGGGERAGLEDDLSLKDVLAMQDVLSVEEAEDDQQAMGELVMSALDAALDSMTAMRSTEGAALGADIAARLNRLDDISRALDERAPEWLEEYRSKLRARIDEICGAQLDEARLAQEVALIADRAAIDEETVRLRSHVSQMRALLALDEPTGRKLDFLVQEMNREVNTTGSKSSDINLTNLVVEAKSEIEKIREQVQNIE